jgi:hypothetical protein
MGVCGIQNVADGTLLVAQKPKDCIKAICMGGAPADVPDPTDLPDDNNACTVDSCNNGVPKFMNQGTGVACTQGGITGVCDGAGTCFQDTCGNGMLDGLETDKDCGGFVCDALAKRCADYYACKLDNDCASLKCLSVAPMAAQHACYKLTCANAQKDGDETDVDCGGNIGLPAACPRCAPGQKCVSGSDCASGMCIGGTQKCN